MTGIRLSELIAISDKNLDFSLKNLKVLGKRKKERIIPISNELCDKIKHYISIRIQTIENTEPYLFVRANGKKLYPKMVYNLTPRLFDMPAIVNGEGCAVHVRRRQCGGHFISCRRSGRRPGWGRVTLPEDIRGDKQRWRQYNPGYSRKPRSRNWRPLSCAG